MKIRFLYFKGCPNAKPALKLLKEVLKEKGIKDEFSGIPLKEMIVRTLEEIKK